MKRIFLAVMVLGVAATFARADEWSKTTTLAAGPISGWKRRTQTSG